MHPQGQFKADAIGPPITRRLFLAQSAGALALCHGCSNLGVSQSASFAIDTHTHFYDPTRAQGVPWPPSDDAVLSRPVYPAEFKRLASAHGVAGTVVVEASPWLEDNQWILDLASNEPAIFGFVGQLKPGRAEFAAELGRFIVNPLFRGIRVGAWARPVTESPDLLGDLKILAERDLSLDVLIGTDRLADTARLAARLPSLRIIIDHCANVRVNGAAPPAAWLDGLAACARQPNIFMKVSGLVEGTGRTDGTAPATPALYRPTLDAIWERFGEERLIFGSNWPVSSRFAPYDTVIGIVKDYFELKGPPAARKYFWDNAARVYKFARR